FPSPSPSGRAFFYPNLTFTRHSHTIYYMNKSIFLIKAISGFFLFLILVSPALATKPENIAVGTGNSKRPSALVTTAKMKSCQARESAVKIRMTQLTKLVTTMEITFDKIAERVQKYYTDKVLPSGRSLTGYDTLVNNISTQKIATQTALDKAKADISVFSCDSENPRALLLQFNTNMKLVKGALKTYRAAINKLIVAIRTIPAPTTTPTNNVTND
ncbi:MAG: hypothetical protein UW64_C0016G0019, partial [Microgenomates group bacterium GW2011_GWC1_44_37]